MADVTVNNPLGDDENFDDDKGKGGGGSSTPVIIGASAVIVLLIVVSVIMMGGDDDAPATVVVTTPAPSPAGGSGTGGGTTTPAVSTCAGHACVHGTCVEGTPYTCACDGIISGVTVTGGAVWQGDMCDTLPDCGVCGATPYCGARAGCDPMVPPAPVVAQLTFAVDIATLGEEGSRERRLFESNFASDMAAALEVPASSIVVLAVVAGSVRVDFAILPNANFVPTEGGGGGYAFDPADKLLALAQIIADDSSTLFTESATFAALGLSTNVPLAIPAASQNMDMMCNLHLQRLEMCNGQLSAAAVCSDRNCIVALEGAAAAAAGDCVSAAGFTNIPSAASIGCNADGSVTPAIALADTLPAVMADKAAMIAYAAVQTNGMQSFGLNELAANGGADAMDGDSYIVPEFGAHFDGDGDRVQLSTGTTYATDDPAASALGDGTGFAVGFWFTKEVCNAVQDRYEMLYMHTGDATNPLEMLNATGTVGGILASISCGSQFSSSTAGGDIVSFRLKDDNGVSPQFDWQIGCAGSAPGLEGTWIQLILSVSPTSIRVYADGVEQNQFGFPVWGSAGASITNPAYPNPNRLSETLGAISLAGTASVGNVQGDISATGFHAGYTGRMAWVQIFTTAISVADSGVLYAIPDLVAGCPAPEDTPTFVTGLDLPLTVADDAVALMGNVAVHEEFGLHFDGLDDWAEVTAPAYTADKSFTVTFWASQTLCNIPGAYEALFYHGTPGSTDLNNADSMVGLFIICYGDTPRIMTQVQTGTSAAPGPKAQLMVTGDDDVIKTGGYETSNWISFGMSVSPTSLMLYVDGMPVSITSDDLYGWGWSDNAGSATDLENSNQANPNPLAFGTPLGEFTGLGDKITLGALPTGEAFFEGDLQALTIFDDALDMHAHDCLYQELEKTVATCAEPGQPTWGRGGRTSNYFATFTDGEVPEGTFLLGDTYQNGAYGLQFDGDEDYLLVKGDAMDFANDGGFAVAFWFTKPVCNIPGRWEFVFSQLENEDMPVTWSGNSGVDMFIGCGERNTVSTVGGDILRTVLVDSGRDRAMFDIQIDYFGGGVMTDTWVHVVMNVHRSSGCGGNRRGGGGNGRRRMQWGGGGGAATCTGAAPNPWDSMTPAQLAAMRNRFGGQGEVCDMGGAEIYINGQQLPRDAMGFPCDPQNPCNGGRGGVAPPANRMEAMSQVISAGGDDPAAMIAMIMGARADRPTDGDQPTQNGNNRGNQGRGGAGGNNGGRGGAGGNDGGRGGAGGDETTVYIINAQDQCGESTFPTTWASAGLAWLTAAGYTPTVGTCASMGYATPAGNTTVAGTGAPSDPTVTLYAASTTIYIINAQDQCGESTFPTTWATTGLAWITAAGYTPTVGTCASMGYATPAGSQTLPGTGAPSDPTVTLYTAGGRGGAGGSDRSNGARNRVINVAMPDPSNFSRPLRGFDASSVYRNDRAFEVALNEGGGQYDRSDNDDQNGNRPGGLAPGVPHVFHAKTSGRNGWSGGYWEIVDGTGATVAGGVAAGVVNGDGSDTEFTIDDPIDYSDPSMAGCACQADCSNTYQSRGRTRTSETWFCEVTDEDNCDMNTFWGGRRGCLVPDLKVRIVTSQNAGDISWTIDDGAMYDGPAKSSIYIGGRAGLGDDNYFLGSLAGLTINSRPMEKHEVECMYMMGEESIGQCGPADDVGFSASLFGSPGDSTPPLTVDARADPGDDPVNLHGHTYLDSSFGAVLDGDRDYITFADAGYTSNDFTVSFWFLKNTACESPGRWQFLYSEAEDSSGQFYRSEGSALEVYMACSRDEGRGAEGDILRTFIRDNDGKRAAFDINVDEFRSGGPITGSWVHYVLAVDDRAIRMYIDGTPTGPSTAPPGPPPSDDRNWRNQPDTDGQTITFGDGRGWMAWMQTSCDDADSDACNMAYPNPEQLNGRMNFGIAEVYNTWRDQAVMLDNLTAATTYTMNYGNGVDAAGYFMVNSTVVTAVDAVAPADAVVEACIPYCENVDLTSRWVTTTCGMDPQAQYGIPGWCSYTAANDTAGIVSACTSVNASAANCGATVPAGDANSCPGGCQYQAEAAEVLEVVGVTGVYNNLVMHTLTGFSGSVTFTTPAATETNAWLPGGIFLTMHTPREDGQWDVSARLAAELRWSIDNTDFYGPQSGTTYLGSRSDLADEHYYMGSFAGVMVQTNDVGDEEAFCAYQSGEKQLGVCDWDSDAVKVNVLGGRNMDGGTRGWGVDMGGNAHMEDDYGVTLDGMGDYLQVQGDDLDYAQTGSFAISFWFTKAVCHTIGDYEILYSHHANPDGWAGCRHGPDGTCNTCNPGIMVMLGCFSDGTDGWTASSTVSGDVIRTQLTDDNCNTATWDTPLDTGSGGYVTDAWVHFAMSTWSRGAHVYVDGESIDSVSCRAKDGAPRSARRACWNSMYGDAGEAGCLAVMMNDTSLFAVGIMMPACDYTAGEDGYPAAEGQAARWWGWATTPANTAWPSPRHFQTAMGPYTLWQEPTVGEAMVNNVTLDAGTHTFTPGCRGCSYARTGWGDAYWSIIGSDGTVLAGGESAGRVETINGEEVCEGPNRFDVNWCEDEAHRRCCEWNGAWGGELPVAGADSNGDGLEDIVQGGGGQCWSRVGDGSCQAVDANITFTVPADTEVIVAITIPRSMENSWVIEWTMDDGGFGMEGPIRGPLFMGAQNSGNDDDGPSQNNGYSGSIAGIKTFSRALNPTAAECIYQEAETEVGICDEVGGVIYEGEFTAGGQAANDPERDLGGPVTSGVATIAACLAICQEEYRYFGLQWGSACQCGNDYGQHGHAAPTAGDVTRDSRGGSVNIPAMDGECNWACSGNHDDSCTAAHGPTCDGYVLDGTAASCTGGVGECTYTPADTNTVVVAESCVSPVTDYCSNVNLDGNWALFQCSATSNLQYGIPGGCTHTYDDPATLNVTETSCDATLTDATCAAELASGGEAACNAMNCSFTAAVTQAEACVATATAACEAAAVNDDALEVGGDADEAADRATCEGAASLTGGATACAYDPEVEDMCGAADRNSIYAVNIDGASVGNAANVVTADYIGCFNDASSDDDLEMVGDTFQDQGESFVGGEEVGFGLTFDGDGDYATLKRTEGYTSDGTFSIVFWFTKTPCNDPEQPYEMLYSHMNAAKSFRDPHLFIQLGCAHSDVHSTAGDGDIIRIAMQDNDGSKYLFDTPLLDAAGGGFVTSMWIHFALAVSTTGARVFLDGVDCSDDFGHPEPTNRWVNFAQTYENLAYPDPTAFHPGTAPGPLGYRAMAGTRMDMDNHPNISTAVTTCSNFCQAEGYRYMGLEWETECYCDNQYDGRGEGLAVNDDGSSKCGETDASPMPVCGSADWEDSCDRRGRNCACGYALAVFDAYNQSNYIGCYQDGPGDEYTSSQWNGMHMTMDLNTYGDGGDDTGTFMEWMNLTAGSGTGADGRHYDLHKLGNSGGWSDGTSMEVWQNVVAVGAQTEDCVPRDLSCDRSGEDCEAAITCAAPTADADGNMGCDPASTYVGNGAPIPDGSIPDCSYMAPRTPVVGGLTLLTGGGYRAETCTNATGVCEVDISGRGSRDKCESQAGCAYTGATCVDGCLDDHEDEWIGFDTIMDGTAEGAAEIVIKIDVTSWGNSVSWQLANMDMSWQRGAAGFERRNIIAEGPVRGHPTLGGTGGDGWYSHEEYTGSIGAVGIYWRPLDAEDITCLYKRSENILTVCVAPEDMPQYPFYTNMNAHDLDGDQTDLDSRATVESCAEFCADFQYFGLEWGHRCSCGNTYGSYGELDAGECDQDCAGYDTSDTDMPTNMKCGGSFKNSIYQEKTDGMGWTDWAVPAPYTSNDQGNNNGDTPTDSLGYVDCQDSTFGLNTDGIRSQCQCQGPGGIITNTVDERESMVCLSPTGEAGMVRYGSAQFEYIGCFQDRYRDQDGITTFDNTYIDSDYGMTFDGEGDYAEVDMERNGRWLTDDGSFTMAFWATKTACTVPSWWESVISYYKYPDMSTRDPRNTHINIQMGCASYADSTVEGDVMRVDTLDDSGARMMFDFSMDSSTLPGPDGRATDTWVHVVISFGTQETKMYVDGKDVCPQSRGGGPGRGQSCPGVGIPIPGRRNAWTMTPCMGPATGGQNGRGGGGRAGNGGGNQAGNRQPVPEGTECNMALTGGGVSGFDMTYTECAKCEDAMLGDDGQYPCEVVIPYLSQESTSAMHPWFNATGPNAQARLCATPLAAAGAQAGAAADTSGLTFGDVCLVTCGTCDRGDDDNDAPILVPGCDVTNSSSPGANPNDRRGRNKKANLFLGGAPNGQGRFFTGSLNGFGLFRYSLTQQEASCLFRFGEFDIHVCPKVEDMNGLLYAMTFLPAEPAMPASLPHGGGSCRRALNDCVVDEIVEGCAPQGHDATACLESSTRTANRTDDMEWDDNCCAPQWTAACAPGFTMMTGDACWVQDDGTVGAWSTYCIPDGSPRANGTATVAQDPMPTDCSFTAGDVTTCAAAAGCDYMAPVPQAMAVNVEVLETCSPADSNQHCTWGAATCTSPWTNTDNGAARCHDDQGGCEGDCMGSWCANDPALDCATTFTAGDGATCPDGCDYVAPVVAGSPVCADAASSCSAAYDDAPDRCVFTPNDAATPAYDPSCVNPMGTPAGKDFCKAYCVTEGFSMAGLSGSRDCFCGNNAGNGGMASPTECDADHDGVMDCGTFSADSAWWRSAARPPCGQRIAVYMAAPLGADDVAGSDEVGCFRSPTGAPEGLTLGGNAYLDDSGRHSGGSWRSGVGEVDDSTSDDFGIHFDGAGDYAQVGGVDNGYAADGSFAISLWATKPNCATSGKEEIIYKHGDLRRATILLLYVCGNDPSHQHTTLQQSRSGRFSDANFIRVYLQDDDRKRAVFDVSADKDGGYVTDTWIHLLVSVSRDHVRAYVDGSRQWRIGYPVPVLHALNDKQNQWMQVAWGEDPHQKCAEFCEGFTYSGVQNTAQGQQCFCDNELPTTTIPAHCTFDGDCTSDILHGQVDACHGTQANCEGACNQGGTATWCPASDGDQAPENRCGVGGSVCGAAACEDNGWLCTADRLTDAPVLPNATDPTALTALCDTDMHAMAGMGSWMEAGSLVRSMCPVMCGECTPDPNPPDTVICTDVIAVTELATRQSGGVVVLGYMGCYNDNEDAAADNWQDPEVNNAYPDTSDMSLGTFNIDHGYGDGGRDDGDYFINVPLATSDSSAGTTHEFHSHGRDGGWSGGMWRVLSSDSDLCEAVNLVTAADGACAAAGVCSIQPDVVESCDTAYEGHTESACLEMQAGGAMGEDANCCAIAGNGGCASGYTYTQGEQRRCGFQSYCSDDVTVATPVYDDCSSFNSTTGSTTCPTGCTYTAPTNKCAAAVIASGSPSEMEQFTSFDATNTGSMRCEPNDRGLRGCRISMDGDAATNSANCLAAVGATCTYTAGIAGGADGTEATLDTCTATAVTECATAADEDSCTAASVATPYGSDGMGGCVYTAPDTSVVVHIHTTRWGNYISWEMHDVATGSVEGFGPDSSPIELGGMEGMERWGDAAPWEAFNGNIADLLIFYRQPSDDDVDCLYRAQQANIGKCRAPEGMWGTTFWDDMTSSDGQNPSLMMWGSARIEGGVGLDLTANNEPMAMSGAWALMDGLTSEPYNRSQPMPALTPAVCVARCLAQGFAFAGLMGGEDCVCDNVYDMYGVHTPTADELRSGSDGCVAVAGAGAVAGADGTCVSTCSCTVAANADGTAGDITRASCALASTPATYVADGTEATAAITCDYNSTGWDCGARACAGDATQTCGGQFKLAVYDTSMAATDAGAYKGCYDDHTANSLGAIRMRDGSENFATDAKFTVSLWFTHNQCDNVNATGNWEPLYHQSGEECVGCPTQGIDIFLVCGADSMIDGSVVTGNVLRVMLGDDDGAMVSLDIPFGAENSRDESGGVITAAWVHAAVVSNADEVTVYIDGVAVTNYGIAPWMMDGNLALGHVESNRRLRRSDGVISLEAPLSGMTFGMDSAVCLGAAVNATNPRGICGTPQDCPDACQVKYVSTPYLGAYFGEWAPSFFNGYLAQLGIFRRALSKSEVSCLFKYGESHLGLPTGLAP